MPVPSKSNASGARVREVIFLGTGTSETVPTITCLLEDSPKCKTCALAMTVEGKKNLRRNTSMLVRIDHPDGRERNVVIDCGKTFYQSALDVFVKHNVKTIDAVLITHGHADAILGLDDLRQWTMYQGVSIPIYADRQALDTISSMFPYLVNTKKATGSGDVSELDFRVIEEPYNAFECQGISFQPLRVEHGRFSDGRPFYFTGFQFDGISYVSDCSHIPDETAALMMDSDLLVLDALTWKPYHSHFGFWQALDEVRRLKPRRTLLTGFCHTAEHSEVEEQGRKLRREENIVLSPAFDGMKVVF
ncbi:hypothetical protein LPJ81_004746 [Coemansia sp. IMI 209127]|nr:hypothetical protein LPJ81_004746 [Coemansia sp. IMI 209127]